MCFVNTPFQLDMLKEFPRYYSIVIVQYWSIVIIFRVHQWPLNCCYRNSSALYCVDSLKRIKEALTYVVIIIHPRVFLFKKTLQQSSFQFHSSGLHSSFIPAAFIPVSSQRSSFQFHSSGLHSSFIPTVFIPVSFQRSSFQFHSSGLHSSFIPAVFIPVSFQQSSFQSISAVFPFCLKKTIFYSSFKFQCS